MVDEAYPPLIEAATGCVHRIMQSHHLDLTPSSYTIEPLRKLLRPADLSLLEQDLHLAYYGPYLAPRRAWSPPYSLAYSSRAAHVNLIGQSEEKDSAVISVEIVQNSNNDNLARVYVVACAAVVLCSGVNCATGTLAAVMATSAL